MIQLLICRHSKSESPDLPKPDHDRKLTSRGERDARSIGKVMAERGLIPTVILASDSTRTRQTATLVSRAFPIKPETTFLPELYSASGGEIMNIVASCAADARTILVIGHNPGAEEIVQRLAGREVRLKTSTVAVFETDGERGPDTTPLEGMRLLDVFGPPA